MHGSNFVSFYLLNKDEEPIASNINKTWHNMLTEKAE